VARPRVILDATTPLHSRERVREPPVGHDPVRPLPYSEPFYRSNHRPTELPPLRPEPRVDAGRRPQHAKKRRSASKEPLPLEDVHQLESPVVAAVKRRRLSKSRHQPEPQTQVHPEHSAHHLSPPSQPITSHDIADLVQQVDDLMDAFSVQFSRPPPPAEISHQPQDDPDSEPAPEPDTPIVDRAARMPTLSALVCMAKTLQKPSSTAQQAARATRLDDPVDADLSRPTPTEAAAGAPRHDTPTRTELGASWLTPIDIDIRANDNLNPSTPNDEIIELGSYRCVLRVEGETKDFVDLPSPARAAIQAKFDLQYGSKHRFASVMLPARLKALIATQECLNLRLYFQSKGNMAHGEVACEKCRNNERICVRPRLVDDTLVLCIFPPPSHMRHSTDWAQEGYWLV
jgi:hypothetical protein